MKNNNTDLERPSLVVNKIKANEILLSLLKKGDDIKNMNILDENQLKSAQLVYDRWIKYCSQSLETIFENKFYAIEFGNAVSWGHISHDFTSRIESLMSHVDEKKAALESIRERLNLIQEVEAQEVKKFDSTTSQKVNSKNIFIVHGHDKEVLQNVARYISELGLNPVVLQEKASQGMTIIEKLEHYSRDCNYAVILLTPDDKGYAINRGPEDVKSRARQNVIAELGFFVGRLGRKNVCVIHLEEVEIPSDFDGVIYVPYDKNEGWKLKLAKEIKQSGILVDTSKLLG